MTTLEQAQIQIAELEERIRQLEAALGLRSTFPAMFQFTRTEQRVLGVFAARRVVTSDMLHVAMYGDRADGGPTTARETGRVMMVGLRKKLKRFGVRIMTLYGTGYEISERDQKTLRDAARPG